MTVEFVTSADGTRIALEWSGDGPALLLVGGGLSDRSSSTLLAPHLQPSFTVWTFDRRGRGDSGDAAAYAVEREVEDIAALLGRIGEPAAVLGHSSGAILSLEAALAGLPISALALYEPPYVVDGLRPRPPALTMPVLVLQGGASPDWMRAGTEALARTLPHGRLVVLPGQGHTAARDAPAVLAGELVRFFRG